MEEKTGLGKQKEKENWSAQNAKYILKTFKNNQNSKQNLHHTKEKRGKQKTKHTWKAGGKKKKREKEEN